MRPLFKGMLLACLHLAIVSSLGGKLLLDRATRPRVWVQTVSFDPDLPIRGRYVRLSLVVDAREVPRPKEDHAWNRTAVDLSVKDDRLVATPSGGTSDFYDSSKPGIVFTTRGRESFAVLDEPVAFFIPEHATDPSIRRPGEEIWVEVTLPRKGPPRPIQLGVRKDGAITPLPFR